MKNEIRIVNYSPEFEDLHYEFATNMFGTRRKRRNPDYIYWKFRGEPNKSMSSFKLALKENKIIGQLGLIPDKINLNGEVIDTQWACDLMVSKDHRGKGVANLLYKTAHDQKRITLGSDPSPSAEKSMLRAGYKKLKSSNKQFVPVYLGVPFKMKGLEIKALNSVKNPFLKIHDLKSTHSKFIEMDIYKASHEQIFKRSSNKRISIAVDDAFKNWRFSSFKDYYPGVKLFQLENTKTFFSGYYHGKIYFITDMILAQKKHFNNIINYILGIIPKKIERIRFHNNEDESTLGSKFTTIKYSTKTSIIYYTDDTMIDDIIKDKYFYYTHQDSDENV